MAFCSGRDFTAGGLRHWAHRLSKGGGAKSVAPVAVRFARVKRTEGRSRPSAVSAAPPRPAITVEIGVARVSVGVDFDRATLAEVLDVLGLRDLGGAR